MRLMHAITFCQSSLVMSVLGFQNCIVAIHALWSYCSEPVLILRLPLSILFACVCVCVCNFNSYSKQSMWCNSKSPHTCIHFNLCVDEMNKLMYVALTAADRYHSRSIISKMHIHQHVLCLCHIFGGI